MSEAYFHHCIRAAQERHQYAQFLLRMARRDPMPIGSKYEHRLVEEAKRAFNDARAWIENARMAKRRERNYDYQ